MIYTVNISMDEESWEAFKWNAYDLIPGLEDWELIEYMEE